MVTAAIKFKEPKLKGQFYGSTKDRVRETVAALSVYLWQEFHYRLTVTSVLENKEIPSVDHAAGRAVDVRGHDMPGEVVGNAVRFCLVNFPRKEKVSERQALSCWPHEKGDNFHLHISQDS